MTTVGITVARAREVAGQLEQQLRIVDGLRQGHSTVLELALDWGVLRPIRTAMGEFTEDTGNSATLLRALADYSEAADNGAEGGELAYFEALAISALQRVQAGLDEGVGSAATDAEVNVHLEAYFSSDEYRLRQLQYGDFDLGESIVGGNLFPDRSARHRAIPNTAVDGFEYYGGGAIRGPDGQYYAIVVPTATLGSTKYTHNIPRGVLDRFDPGWTTIAYRTGSEQFSNEPSGFAKLGISAGVFLGNQIGTSISDDHLAAVRYDYGRPPRLVAAPRVPFDTSEYGGLGDAGPSGIAVDQVVNGANSVMTYNSLDDNLERGFEVVFQEHVSGSLRATLTTYQLDANPDGAYLSAWNVHVAQDGRLQQTPAHWVPQDVPRVDVPGVDADNPFFIPDQADLITYPQYVPNAAIAVDVSHLPEGALEE